MPGAHSQQEVKMRELKAEQERSEEGEKCEQKPEEARFQETDSIPNRADEQGSADAQQLAIRLSLSSHFCHWPSCERGFTCCFLLTPRQNISFGVAVVLPGTQTFSVNWCKGTYLQPQTLSTEAARKSLFF